MITEAEIRGMCHHPEAPGPRKLEAAGTGRPQSLQREHSHADTVTPAWGTALGSGTPEG